MHLIVLKISNNLIIREKFHQISQNFTLQTRENGNKIITNDTHKIFLELK